MERGLPGHISRGGDQSPRSSKIVGLSMLTKEKPAFTSLREITSHCKVYRLLAPVSGDCKVFHDSKSRGSHLQPSFVTGHAKLTCPHVWVASVTHRTSLEPLDITWLPRQLKSSANDAGAASRITCQRRQLLSLHSSLRHSRWWEWAWPAPFPSSRGMECS